MQKYTLWEKRNEHKDDGFAENIAQQLNIAPAVARLIVSRGITSVEQAREYLFSSEDKLFSPFLFADMQVAVKRIQEAMTKKERIVLYGDYDADGIMGVSILYSTIRPVYESIDYLLPDRFEDGYGLNTKVIEKLHAEGYKLIITVDNGINAEKEIAYAAQKGIDTIITDHHEAPEELPQAVAILNPKVAGEKYPNKDLCGAGVACKLAVALVKEQLGAADSGELLSFAMIGTVADIVPLTGENRHLTALGLRAARKTKNAALIQMFEDAAVKPEELEAGHIGYRIAPRINAAGRMTNANEAVAMFCSDPPEIAREKAALLGKINAVRQQTEKEIYEEADAFVKEAGIESKDIWVIAQKGWHEGVIGITAGRLAEAYNRPFLLLSIGEDGICKGSARSIVGFNIYEAILSASDCLLRFGGHSAAAGFSLNADRLEEFDARLNEYARAQDIGRLFRFKRQYDAVSDRPVFTEKFISELNLMAPFGYRNPKPVLRLNGCAISKISAMGATGEHISCNVQADGCMVRGVAFSQSESFEHIRKTDKADILFYPTVNRFRNITSVEYEIKDIFFYEEFLKEYQEALYEHFITFYREEEYTPDIGAITLRVEDVIQKDDFEVIVAYSYEMLKRIQRCLRHRGQEEVWHICFNEVPDEEKDKRYILMCPTKLPAGRRIAVAEYNYFDTLEQALYKEVNYAVLRRSKPYRDEMFCLNRAFLGFVFTRLEEISEVCSNSLYGFVRHLNGCGQYRVDYVNLRLALDVFASLSLLNYTYDRQNDLILLEKLSVNEKKDLNSSDIMIKLYDIQKPDFAVGEAVAEGTN